MSTSASMLNTGADRDSKPPLHVAVGVILNTEQEILIALRPEHRHQGGLWEFPGGKVEADENVEQALDRELFEELGLRVTASRPLIEIRHDYTDKSVLLDVWWVDRFSGQPQGKEGQPIRWVAFNELDNYAFPQANKAIVAAIQSQLTVAG